MKVFLSYASLNKILVADIDYELAQHAVLPYRDTRNLKGGNKIADFINSITEMDYAIMLISPAYFKSTYCIDEYAEYLTKDDSDKTLLPIRIEPFDFSNEFKNKIIASVTTVLREEARLSRWEQFKLNLLGKKIETEEKWLAKFTKAWEHLKQTKMFDYAQLKETEFRDLLIALNLHENEIQKELNKINAEKNPEEQDVIMESLLLKYPGNYWVTREKAMLAKKRGQYKKAIALFRDFVVLYPADFKASLIYYEIGDCYLQLNEYHEAKNAFVQSLEISESNFLSFSGLGAAYYCLGELDLANKWFSLCRLSPHKTACLVPLGVIELSKGKNDEAVAFFRQAIREGFKEPIVYVLLAACYDGLDKLWEKQENRKIARTILTEALELYPKNDKILTGWARLHFNITDKSTISKTIRLLIQSFKINPKNIETRIWLVWSLTMFVSLGYAKESKEKYIRLCNKITFTTFEMNPISEFRNFLKLSLQMLNKQSPGSNYNTLLDMFA